jgi:integrase
MLELMAKGGMRIGEVLKIRPIDVKDSKIRLPDPKSGRESEIVYIPQKIADRLREYIQDSRNLRSTRVKGFVTKSKT